MWLRLAGGVDLGFQLHDLLVEPRKFLLARGLEGRCFGPVRRTIQSRFAPALKENVILFLHQGPYLPVLFGDRSRGQRGNCWEFAFAGRLLKQPLGRTGLPLDALAKRAGGRR